MDIEHEERQKLNRALDKKSSNPRRRWAIRVIADSLPELAERNARRHACSFHRPCNLSECDHCGGGMPHRSNTTNDVVYQQRADKKQSRGKSKNYRSVAGHWLTEPFRGLDPSQCHPFTIDMYLERRDMNGIETTRRERAKFQSFIKQEMPDAVVRIICDISACIAGEQYLFVPNDSVHPSFRTIDTRPSEIAMNYHGHGIIWHPFLTSYQIAKKMRAFYPGEGRICFSNPKPIIESVDGYLSGGLQGWAEYSGREPTDTKFTHSDPNNDQVAAVRDMLLIRNSWPRSSRKIVYGDKANRVGEIQQLMSVSDDPIVYSDSNPVVSEDDFYEVSYKYIPYITRPTHTHTQ